MNTREKILDSAVELFAARGFDAVGVQEITMKSGITKPTLYHYFGSKSGLLQVIMGEYGSKLSEAVGAAAVYQGDLSLALAELGKAFFEFAKTYPVFYRMQLAMYFAPPKCESNQMVRRFNEIQFHLIEELFKAATVHHHNLKDRHGALAASFIGHVNTYIGFALNGYIELREEIIYQIVHQFMYGIYL
jgi:TetR/AcrR family transcriptional regulator